jgi:hypothetical protein
LTGIKFSCRPVTNEMNHTVRVTWLALSIALTLETYDGASDCCLHPWHPVPGPSPQNAERKRTHFVWLSSRHGLFGSNVTKIGRNSFTLERTRQHRFRYQRVTNDSDPRGRFRVFIRLRHLNSGPPGTGTTPHSSFSSNTVSRTPSEFY